ncbi:Glycosyl transferase family 2 [Haladaptatus litoreus]|uniref:Glycosyl transferase family 2 n=1 Tax=Haladaptatus litoreus TaxID=553468 RepID=A0A1N6YT49_9EURY|nr:glycosyltransferase family A protein [Haladaptatus litoreus]SIR17736.1 Glycosyl transferase family 2 [Haladaptatus litoreus]
MTIERVITASQPKLSVVIPTIPSNSHEEVISHLELQNINSFEAIVVNDANLDICEARNAGIEAANSDIVALTDDDCRPEKEWLSNVLAEFDSHPNLVCLEGGVGGGRTYGGVRKYVGCNLSFKRDTALAVDGFNSDYAGWRDDTEFGWRMERDADGDCRYSDSVRMVHPKLPRATIDCEMESKLRTEFPTRYENVIIPDTTIGRINDWLWRKGIWESVDAIRYRK